MGLLDQILGAATSSTGAASAQTPELHQGLLEHVMSMISNQQAGGLAGLVEKLKAGGMGPAVSSWVGSGPNQAATPDQVTAALGQDQISQLAQKFGLSPSVVASHLSQIFPEVINHLPPNGSMPSHGIVAEGIAMLRAKLFGN